MKQYSIFDLTTGQILGVRNSFKMKDDIALEAGQGVIEGAFDALSYRVDVSTGKAIDWQPERPSADHYWDSISRRWLLSPFVQENVRLRAEIIQSIKEIDERLVRPMSELFDNPQDVEARKIYSQLKTEKDKLRARLQSLSGV